MQIRVGHYYKGHYDNHLYVLEEVHENLVILRHLVLGKTYNSDLTTFEATFSYYNP